MGRTDEGQKPDLCGSSAMIWLKKSIKSIEPQTPPMVVTLDATLMGRTDELQKADSCGSSAIIWLEKSSYSIEPQAPPMVVTLEATVNGSN